MEEIEWRNVKIEQIQYYFSDGVDEEEQYIFCKRLYENNKGNSAYVFWFLMGAILGGVSSCKLGSITIEDGKYTYKVEKTQDGKKYRNFYKCLFKIENEKIKVKTTSKYGANIYNMMEGVGRRELFMNNVKASIINDERRELFGKGKYEEALLKLLEFFERSHYGYVTEDIWNAVLACSKDCSEENYINVEYLFIRSLMFEFLGEVSKCKTLGAVYDCIININKNYDEKVLGQDKLQETGNSSIKDNLIQIAMSNEFVKASKKLSVADYCGILSKSQQMIIQGPPGTGKTRMAKMIAAQMVLPAGEVRKEEELLRLTDSILDNTLAGAEKAYYSDKIKLVQFHPAYSYEDFIIGIGVSTEGNNLKYSTQKGLLKSYADSIIENNNKVGKNHKYVLIIDEINRAPMSMVFGELLYALEKRNQSIVIQNEQLTIPDNLYLIGTLNTADYSIGSMDYAMRRRFAFVDLNSSAILGSWVSMYDAVSELMSPKYMVLGVNIKNIKLGGSYFILQEETDDARDYKLNYQIVPMLMEYYRDGFFRKNAKLQDGQCIRDIFQSKENLENYLRDKGWSYE